MSHLTSKCFCILTCNSVRRASFVGAKTVNGPVPVISLSEASYISEKQNAHFSQYIQYFRHLYTVSLRRLLNLKKIILKNTFYNSRHWEGMAYDFLTISFPLNRVVLNSFESSCNNNKKIKKIKIITLNSNTERVNI